MDIIDEDTEGDDEEDEPENKLELGEGRVVGGPGEQNILHAVAVVVKPEERGVD